MSVKSSVNSTSTSNESSEQTTSYSLCGREDEYSRRGRDTGWCVRAGRNELLLVNNEGIAAGWVGRNADW